MRVRKNVPTMSAYYDRRPPDCRLTILYTRVSTDEQAERGNSLRDQETRLREYCARTGRVIVDHYKDDHSAKTFDRPQFNCLLRFLEKNRGKVNELLVLKWDRFSRDMSSAWSMIDRLHSLGVEIQSSEQPVDWSIPENRLMIAFYLASPDVENRRRSLNATTGMRRAARDGRWCNAPPIGYRRVYDDRGRANIAPSEMAEIVREAFRLAADTDCSLEDIHRRMRKRGLQLSRSHFYTFLQNPIYKGRIRLEAWRDEREEEIAGSFVPVVPAALFDQVQQRRFRRLESKPTRRSDPRIDLILRGHLACPYCSSNQPVLVTGSFSTGKLGTRYSYYHCHRCKRYRVRAADALNSVERFLQSLQIDSSVADLYKSIVRDMARKADRERDVQEHEIRRKLQDVEDRLFKADEALVEGQIERDSHARLKKRYDDEALSLREQLSDLEHLNGDFATRVEIAADLFTILPNVWQTALEQENAEAASDLLGSIAPEKLVYDGEAVRTPFGSTAKGLFRPESQKMKTPALFLEPASCQACPGGFEPPTF